MIRQFHVTPELQQFLSGLGSKALTNVLWNRSYLADSPVLPLSPDSVRRALLYSHLDATQATPTEFDVFLKNLDGTAAMQITRPR